MKDVSYLPGVLLASIAIGPLVAAGGILLPMIGGPVDWNAAWGVPLVMLFALPVGLIASIVPNLLGAALLGWAGRGNIALRLPAMWGLAGAAMGAMLVVVVSGGTADAGSAALLAIVGSVSALLCRWKTSWTMNDLSMEEGHEDDRERPHPARAVARPRRHAADRWLH